MGKERINENLNLFLESIKKLLDEKKNIVELFKKSQEGGIRKQFKNEFDSRLTLFEVVQRSMPEKHPPAELSKDIERFNNAFNSLEDLRTQLLKLKDVSIDSEHEYVKRIRDVLQNPGIDGLENVERLLEKISHIVKEQSSKSGKTDVEELSSLKGAVENLQIMFKENRREVTSRGPSPS